MPVNRKSQPATNMPISTSVLTPADQRLLRGLNRSDLEIWLQDLASVDAAKASQIRRELGVPQETDYGGRIRGEVLDFFGITLSTLDNWQHQGMPMEYRAGHASGPKNPNRYNLKDIARWLHNKRAGGAPDEEAQRLNVQIKQEKMRAMEIKRLEAEGVLIDADAARQSVLNVCATIRRSLEKLQSTYGNQLVSAMNEVVEHARKELFGEQDTTH